MPGYQVRLNKAFENALTIPLRSNSKFILMSDCHRGTGTSSDNFLKNQNLFFAALTYYYDRGFTYIELGDGDELWENRSFGQIVSIHDNAFWLLSQFYQRGRFYMIYGNHDIAKRSNRCISKHLNSFQCHSMDEELFPELEVHEGLILETPSSERNVYLAHGHQADTLNSTFWVLSKFLVRYVWKPLENLGVLDPTSAARNNTKKKKTEERLSHYADRENQILITGHTHRPMCPTNTRELYFNTGSCVHPRCITGIEIENGLIRLVKWTYVTRRDYTLCVGREVLETTTLFRNPS